MEGKQGNVKSVVHNFFSVNKKSIPTFVLVVVVILLTNILATISNSYVGGMIDSINDFNRDVFIKQLILICGIQMFYLCLSYTSNYCANKVSETSIRRIRLYTYDNLMKADMKWIDDVKLGDIISRVNSDLEALVNVVNHFLTWEVANICMIFVGVIGCMAINWKLAIVSLLVFPILGSFQVKLSQPISKYSELRARAEGRANAKFIDLLSGHGVAKIFGSNELREQYEKTVDESVENGVKSASLEFRLYPIQSLLSFVPFIVMYSTAVWLVKRGELTLGGVVSFTLIFLMVSQPMFSISGQVRFIFEAIGLSARVFELWAIAPEELGGEITKPTNDIPVEMINVDFSYESHVHNEGEDQGIENKKILDGLNLSINKGQQIALVGNSGEGKSTIIKILAGFYRNYQGEIKIFGNSIADWNLEKMRNHIAYVGQDGFLFSDSIFENIKLGNPNASNEEVMDVIRDLGLDELDIHTKIGEKGVKLSGGQKQRICIARALLKNADLILLDEPTSALDTESEYAVNQALKKLTEGKTSIIVAHRLSAIRNVDQIICIQEGKIVESGDFEQVMNQEGVIRQLFLQQLREEGLQG